MGYNSNTTPQQDTGWGVIYRLNDLFREVESLSTRGRYDEWNFKLDRIFSNLCYREDLEVKKDENEKILDIQISEESFQIKLFLDKRIVEAKKEMNKAKKRIPEGRDHMKNRDYIVAKNKLYRTLFLKELWLRKYMRQLGLYLKEVEHNPAGAMWGK